MKINKVSPTKMAWSVLTIGLMSSFISQNTWACSEVVKKLQTKHLNGTTLCELQDRYDRAISQLKKKGVSEPEHIGNHFAPRFVNMPDWNNYLAKSGEDDAAWLVYQYRMKDGPDAGRLNLTTWKNWSEAAKIVDADAEKNYKSGQMPIVSKQWLLDLHVTAMNKLISSAGHFRTTDEISPITKSKKAITDSQAISMNNMEYLRKDGTSLIQFLIKPCADRPSRQITPDSDPMKAYSFYDASNVRKRCGDIIYSPLEEMDSQLDQWVSYINESITDLNKKDSKTDVVLTAAKLQRWYISIHPFVDGNGRISRLAMDWVLKSLGLPAPNFSDMNNDIYFSEEKWADEVGKGLLTTVITLEACAADTSALGCKVVASQVPNIEPNQIPAAQ